ncbi:hypothetical protein JCM9140_365 [Halalkalibacter wakoensis JCM 9140]|uniref:DUF4352 domain-containing protein n=1 Tax=Halalkalibacter wakoensis JCM 9140 TaxID=1236970 RepID=W4PYB0_9BACI|nr:DUF4352 domain-containing protein [Halalkalibacter wakoensis]GAE24438.1 hypothetical protein JCM9140_365 [Halalkalibacter wakoensis JCM 9140]
MKTKVILLVGLCTCLLSLVGMYYVFDSSKEMTNAQTIIEDEQTKAIRDLEITLNGVRTEESNDSNSHYVIVDLTFKNNRETVYEASTFKITLVDDENFAHSVTTSIETKGILGGQLHPSRTNRGEVAFFVPKANQYELVYTDHLRTGQVTWPVR